MRIIAGKYGGRNIKTSNKKSIHPMGERIRGAIFNKLFGQLDDKNVLDCFAGSGSIGIESLSRGAKKVTFVEQDRQAAQIIRDNLISLGVAESDYQIVNTTVLNWLKIDSRYQFDLIFADPPYVRTQNQAILAISTLLVDGGTLVLSNPKNAPDLVIKNLIMIDSRTYAEAKINFYKKS